MPVSLGASASQARSLSLKLNMLPFATNGPAILGVELDCWGDVGVGALLLPHALCSSFNTWSPLSSALLPRQPPPAPTTTEDSASVLCLQLLLLSRDDGILC